MIIGCWNPNSWQTSASLFYKIDSMGADTLTAQGVRALAATVSTLLSLNILASAPEG